MESMIVKGIVHKMPNGEWHATGRGLWVIEFSTSYTQINRVLSEAMASWEKLHTSFEVKNVSVVKMKERLWRFSYERRLKLLN